MDYYDTNTHHGSVQGRRRSNHRHLYPIPPAASLNSKRGQISFQQLLGEPVNAKALWCNRSCIYPSKWHHWSLISFQMGQKRSVNLYHLSIYLRPLDRNIPWSLRQSPKGREARAQRLAYAGKMLRHCVRHSHCWKRIERPALNPAFHQGLTSEVLNIECTCHNYQMSLDSLTHPAIHFNHRIYNLTVYHSTAAPESVTDHLKPMQITLLMWGGGRSTCVSTDGRLQVTVSH